MTKKRFLLYMSILQGALAFADCAVTYELSPGRFGDNLLSYIHAKWISYRFGIPLLYKPFVYSQGLVLHDQEKRFEHHKNCYTKQVTLSNSAGIHTANNNETLYTVPYFPESNYELKHGISFSGGAWFHFQVDWSDQKFITLLRSLIQPKYAIASMNVPQDRICVALHMRKGGSHDDQATIQAFPLKFLPEEFYAHQLIALHELFKGYPLYVFIFTDDHNPQAIVQRFQRQFQEHDIIFDCRINENNERIHVLDDFFKMQEFDCLVHSESNYSLLASKLGNYMVSIYPNSFYRKQSEIIYDNIVIQINHDHEKYKKINKTTD